MQHKTLVTKCLFISLIILICFSVKTSIASASLSDAFGGETLGNMAFSAGYENDGLEADYVTIISKVINIILSMLGVVFLVLLIYGGFLWMTARGNEQQVEKAKDTIFSSIIGLIIVLSAYAISIFVVSKLISGVLVTS